MAETIVIKKEYFDNIRTAIDSMNKFFESNFKNKSFPVVNNDFQLDRILARTISWLNNVEPSWAENPKNAEAALKKLQSLAEIQDGPDVDAAASSEVPAETPVHEEEVTKEADESAAGEAPEPATEPEQKAPQGEQKAATPQDLTVDDSAFELDEPDPAINSAWTKVMDGSDKASTDLFHQFIGFKMLQFITNNFDAFENLMNGIYSFELFTKPSQFKNEIQLFTSPLEVPELTEISPLPGEYKLFTPEDYVGSIFDNDQIKLPDDMMEATEIARFAAFTDLANVDVQIDDTVQEAAEVNYFENTKARDIKYNPTSKKWVISKQFESEINKLISALRKCDSTEDLAKLFSTAPMNVDRYSINVIPAILMRVFNSTRKYPFDTHNVDATFPYVKSYKSIVKQNAGARRYERIDLFSTFKTNKEATIKFLEDFLKLNLINSNKPIIADRTLLTVFNIFDSHIYYTILYNLIPKPTQSLDDFIKTSRQKVNASSKAANPYQKDKPTDNKVRTSSQIQESVIETMKELGDLTIADTQYCDMFAEAVYDDISTLGDDLYNKGVSPLLIDRYIGESYDLFPGTGDVYVEWSKRQKNFLAGTLIGFLIPTVLAFSGAPFPKTLIELLLTANPAAIGAGMLSNHIYTKNHLFKDTLEYIDTTIKLLREKIDYPNATDSIKRLKKVCKDLRDSCKVLSHNRDIRPQDQTEFLKMADTCKDFINDIKIGGKNEKLMKEFLEGLFKIREILTGEKLSNIKSKPVQEAVETGDIPDYMKDRIALSDKDPDKKPTTVTDVEVPPDTPTNDIDDLGDSVDARCDHDGNELGDSFGAGYNGQVLPASKGGPGHVVYNITNNYSNSHNTTTTTTNTSTNDLSSGKTITNTNKTVTNNSSVTNANDLSSNKRTNTGPSDQSSNNKDNTSAPANTKESDNTFSNGKSVQEVFALLNSSEPLFVEGDAGEPPKGDVLTTAMDADRQTLSAQQKLKRGVQKAGNTVKAIGKPVTRAKSWLRGLADSFMKRDENAIKADILDNKNYRTAMYKACRLALKTGKFALFGAISPWLGAMYLGKLGLDLADRERLRKEVASEVAVEIQIMDEKIDALKSRSRWDGGNKADQAELYKLMRMRQKLVDMSTDPKKRILHSTKSVY